MEVFMFGRKLVLVLSVLLALGLSGCDSDKEDTYYLALYTISQSTYTGISTSLSADDTLNYAKTQAGTSLAYSWSGYTMQDFKKFCADRNFPESATTTMSDQLEQRGSTWAKYQTVSSDYLLLYAKRE